MSNFTDVFFHFEARREDVKTGRGQTDEEKDKMKLEENTTRTDEDQEARSG